MTRQVVSIGITFDMENAYDTKDLRWIDRSPAAIDFNGPVDIDYDAEAAALLEQRGVEAIERAAARWPERMVLDDGTTRLTYAALMDRVHGLAGRILDATSPGAVVASLTYNSVAGPIIVLACTLAGRTMAPIDAGHPLERQQSIWREAGAQALIVVASEAVDRSFVADGAPVIELDPSAVTGAPRRTEIADPGAPTFLGFTSGSTGRPKGVAAGGSGGTGPLRHFIDMFHLNPSDVILGIASLSTGGSRDAFAALAVGARIRIVDVRKGFADILKVLGEEGITILSFVPSALRAILAVPGVEAAFRTLRILDLHGERILASDIALFRAKLPATCRISITMGSIEAGPVFSWFVDDAKIEGATAPVGYLAPDRRVALVGEDGRSVATGEVGELLVRGPMALGAWSDGRLEPGPFLPDPDHPGARIYPMRDLVRQREDGLFEYIGRQDRQVKIRGQWADLGEIEAAFRAIDAIADVAVITASQESRGEGDRLVAFVVAAPGAELPSISQMRRTVAARTAEHMTPGDIRVLKAIPRLAGHKPDLVRLRQAAQGEIELP